MKKNLALWVVVVILAGLAIPLINAFGGLKVPAVKAVMTETTVNITATAEFIGGWYSSDVMSWSLYSTQEPARAITGHRCGWEKRTDGSNHVFPYNTGFRFPLGSLPADAQITDAKLWLWCSAKSDTYAAYTDFYFSGYITDDGPEGTWNENDNGNWSTKRADGSGGRATAVYRYSDLTAGAYLMMEIPNHDKALTPDGSYVYFEVMTEYAALGYQPSYVSEANGARISFDTTFANTKLQVTYLSEPADRLPALHTNAAVYATPLGTETADNITLETLKCMYDDETVSFLVNGQPGANVTLTMYDENDLTIATHSDTVRVDGIYSWQETLTDITGFVRVHESINDIWSEWVSIQPAPDDSQMTNLVYSAVTDYPQYFEPFDTYVVDDGDYMYVHWKTNMDGSTDLSTYALELWSNGNEATPLYNKSLQTMADDYYSGTAANHENLLHWRYAVFTPQSTETMPDYGGIVQDLSMGDSKYFRQGFIQSVLTQTADGAEAAPCHSAYWYLTGAEQGVKITIADSKVESDEKNHVKITIGEQCKVPDLLADAAYVETNTRITEMLPEVGDNLVEIPVQPEGTHIAYVHLKSNDQTYEYIYGVSYLVVADGQGVGGSDGGGGESDSDIWQTIEDWLGDRGWLSSIGKYILIFALAIILYLLSRKNRVVAAVLAIIPIVLGIIVGWINPWVIALVAVGVGFIVFKALRKTTVGGGD